MLRVEIIYVYELSISMYPTFLMTVCHLRLQEPPKDSLTCPPHPIPLLYSTLNNRLRMGNHVHVYPDALSKHHVKFLICITVFLIFCSPKHSPEALTTPVTVLG